MKARDTVKVSTLRLARSEVRNTEIDKGSPLTEEEVIQVLSKEAKRRRESIDQFAAADRADLVAKESAELEILSAYLPEQLDEAAITGIAQEVILELHAASKADKGKVMSALMPKVRGKADGKLVGQVVDRLLSGSSA
jgi:hypothetical protein